MNRTLHLLLIEDSVTDAELLVEKLRAGHYEPVVRRVDTVEALRAALLQTPWDLVISDYSLPAMSGLEALRWVQESGADIPFVMVSGVVDEEQAIEAIRAGAYDFLRKDRLRRLETVVERVLREAQVRRERRQAEAALRESEDRFRAIFSQTTRLAVLLKPEGAILEANRAFLSFAGRGLDAMIGQPLWEAWRGLFHADAGQRLKQNIETAARAGLVEQEEWVHNARGEEVALDYAVRSLLNPSGRVNLLVFEARDISEQRHLEQEMLKVGQRERQRLGQDLHDTLGQNLVGLAFLSKLLSRKLTETSLPGVQEAQEIEKLANLTSAQAHALANGLCPVDPTADGLMHALQDLGTDTSRLFGMDCHFHCDQSVLIHSDFTALHLYYIAREAVTNALEHGHAQKIRIHLRQRDGALTLTIVADGTPFAQKPDVHRGMGLRTMAYRARVVGGVLDIASQSEGGTIVTCSLPITAPETAR